MLGNGWHPQGLPPIRDGDLIGPGLNAAPNVAAWKRPGDFETPGVFVGASKKVLNEEYTPEKTLRGLSFDGCKTTGSKPYTNADFTGATLNWSCPRGAQWRLVAATPTESRAYLVYLQVKLVSRADVDAFNRILGTFEVDFAA